MEKYQQLERKILAMQRDGSGIWTAYLAALNMALPAEPDSTDENFDIIMRMASRHLLEMIFTVLERIVDIRTEARYKLHLDEARDMDNHVRVIGEEGYKSPLC